MERGVSRQVDRPSRCSLGEGFALFLIATGIVLVGYCLHGAINFNIADEGYLWDGVRRTAAGQVPIRDFHAYDPGRYYWCAAGSRWLGEGLLGLRLTTSLFRILGVFIGLLAVRHVTKRVDFLVLAGILFWWWNPTYYKTFEPTVTFAAVYAGLLLVENPSASRYFLAGITAGLAAIIGRNLGLYAAVAHAGIIAYLYLKKASDPPAVQQLGSWVGGILAGYSPMLLMFAVVPGFFHSFVESVAFHFILGQTNLTLPIPWPWTVPISGVPTRDQAVAVAVGLGFVTWSVFVPVGLVTIFRLTGCQIQNRALLISSVFASLCFAHHAFARADYEHLAHVIPALLLGLIAAMSAMAEWGWKVRTTCLAVATALVTFFAAWPYNFPISFYQSYGERWEYVEREIAGDELLLPVWQVQAIQMFEGVLARHLPAGSRFLVGPYEAGFYPIFGQSCPVWNSYFVLPELESRERRMISELETSTVGLALINDQAAVDGNPRYRFRNSHPLLWQYIQQHYEVITENGLPPGWLAFQRRVGQD
jgi:hypothetical protein